MPGDTAEAEVLPPEAETAQVPPQEDAMPAAMAMLEAIRSGSTDPQKMMLNLLGSQGPDRPETGMLLKLLTENGEDGADEQREQMREEIREEQAEAIAALDNAAERLLAENRACRERLDALAAAIGACPDCFGDDLLCDTCAGAGTPGSRAPQAAEFHTYVRPAVERVRAALRRAPPRRPWPRTPANLAAVETAARAGARP
jgi:hypothetical protein